MKIILVNLENIVDFTERANILSSQNISRRTVPGRILPMVREDKYSVYMLWGHSMKTTILGFLNILWYSFIYGKFQDNMEGADVVLLS
jgi:hypothetical protein